MATPQYSMHEGVRSRSHVSQAAALAARAYADDPFYTYVLANEERRLASLTQMHAAVLGIRNRHELLVSAFDGDRLVGVALWIRPGGFPLRPTTQLRQLSRTMSAFRGHAGAMMRGLGYQRELLANHPKEPHWYLWSLTVEPDMQGRGVGSALTADGLARADAQRCGAYLETQNLENLAFYERFGFAPRGAVQPAPEAPPLYCLWRPSR